MHIQESTKPVTSWREFRREYAMIVLSILTALGFDRAATYLHDRAAAQDSRARIEQEIAANITDLRGAMDADLKSVQSQRAALHDLMADLTSPKPDPAKQKQILTGELQQHLGLSLPAWERDAWDAALADQSAAHMDPRDLRRYAQLYTSARDAADATHILLNGSLFDRLADLSVDLQLNRADGREGAQLLARFLATAEQITAIQRELLAAAERK